jgi:hypothetical protein
MLSCTENNENYDTTKYHFAACTRSRSLTGGGASIWAWWVGKQNEKLFGVKQPARDFP